MTMAAGSMCEVPDEGNEQGMTHTSDPSQQEYSLRDLASDDGVNLRKGEQETIEEVQKRNLSEKLEHKHYSSDFNSYAEVPEMSVRGRDRVEDYLLLQADTASLVGLTRFLVLGSNAGRVVNMGEQGSDVGGIAFELRCTIVFSIVVRWIICFFKKPMKLFGLLLEFFLNGDNLSCSIRNLLTGRIPERGSKNCLSAVGYLDTRVHLHKFCNNSAPEEKEKPGVLEDLVMMDICVMASKIVYENADVVKSIIDEDWKMHFVNLYNFWNEYRKETSTQAFIMCNKRKDADLILISFRGAKTFDASDLCMGFDYFVVPCAGNGEGPNPNLVEDKKVAYYTLRNVLRDLLAEHPKAMFVVTGHGVGGALAALFPALLLFNEEEDLIKRWSAVYTFGQPRIGDEQLQMFMQPYAKKYFRLLHWEDYEQRAKLEQFFVMEYCFAVSQLDMGADKGIFNGPNLWKRIPGNSSYDHVQDFGFDRAVSLGTYAY
ncbi:alpha/beta-Hydrolases superfamily protein [Rhynchospora pubera]|uniref:Alpha/beta-Hydrolases superfamily protein n=1 Tax=Rhynchospora pubera TaxID=906938 RepID=A0AAV8D771_9POAL|nr:alpha/beta-Hydrolases superfamily protein [Rhynchospora pubera]